MIPARQPLARLAFAVMLILAAVGPMQVSRAQGPLVNRLYLPLVRGASPAAPVYSPRQQAMVDAINAARAARGLARLTLVPALFSAAQTHSQLMAATACFSHQCPGELPLGERLTAAGYAWTSCAETIARAPYDDIDAILSLWLASDGHRAILLSADLDDLGIGHALASDGSSHWTADFGVPAP